MICPSFEKWTHLVFQSAKCGFENQIFAYVPIFASGKKCVIRTQTNFIGWNLFMHENFSGKFLRMYVRYAVQNDGVIGIEGCPSPGCDGKQEVKVGTFEQVDKNFRISCSGQAVTHEEANIKHYHHVFRWRAPEAGIWLSQISNRKCTSKFRFCQK